MESQNGYTVIQREECKFYTNVVDGLSLPLRPDECGFVLAHFLRRYKNLVEPLNPGDTFGHALRQIGGSDEWSNHASGTAVDANSVQHPQGVENTFSQKERNDLEELLADYDGVIRWGGTYRTTVDEMHFEIDKEYADVELLARVLRRKNTVTLKRLTPGSRSLDVYMVKRELAKKGIFSGPMNLYFSKGLQTAYAEWQRSLGYKGDSADGVPGTASLEALGLKVKEV